jgi:uncharacterized phage-associated protein
VVGGGRIAISVHERGTAIVTAKEVARYFVAKQDRRAGDSMTMLKLQKLLYYAQGLHLAIYGTPLFNESVRAWKLGPVVREVWDAYPSGRGGQPIPQGSVPTLPDDVVRVLEQVQAAYGQYSAWRLAQMTHQESPWKETRQSATIPQDAMHQYFKAKLASPSKARQSWSEALANPRFKAAVDEGLDDVDAGRTVSWAEVEQSLPSA